VARASPPRCARETPQHRIVEGLDRPEERDTPAARKPGARSSVLGFTSSVTSTGPPATRPHRRDQLRHGFGPQQRRRAAAQIQARRRPSKTARRASLAEQRGG
jgi:hypothetical protein